MGWLILLLLVLAAATGALGVVLKVAAGVALGVVLGLVLVTSLVVWRVRRAIGGPRRRLRPPGPRHHDRRGGWRRIPGSDIEVLDPRDRS